MMLLADRLAAILTDFNLTPTGVSTALNGLSNQVCLAHTQEGPIVVKCYTSLPAARVEQAIRVQRRLKELDAPVNLPLTNRHGRTISEVDAHAITCEPFVAGESGLVYAWTRSFQCDSARLLAQLHQSLAQIPIDDGEWTPVSFWKAERFDERVDQIARLLAAPAHGSSLENRLYQQTVTALTLLKTARPLLDSHVARKLESSQRLIHGDYWPGNLIVDAQSQAITCVLDFENLHLGSPIVDVAHFVSIALAYAKQSLTDHLDFSRIKHFLRSCCDFGLIDPADVAQLHTVILIIRLYSILWILENHYLVGYEMTDPLLEKDLAVVADLMASEQQYRLELEQLSAELIQAQT